MKWRFHSFGCVIAFLVAPSSQMEKVEAIFFKDKIECHDEQFVLAAPISMSTITMNDLCYNPFKRVGSAVSTDCKSKMQYPCFVTQTNPTNIRLSNYIKTHQYKNYTFVEQFFIYAFHSRFRSC